MAITIKRGKSEIIVDTAKEAAELLTALENESHKRRHAAATVSNSSRPHPPRPASPVQDAVRRVLTTGPQTTRQIIEAVERGSYKFAAKDKNIAVNGALVILEKRGEAYTSGRSADGIQKLWVRGKNWH